MFMIIPLEGDYNHRKLARYEEKGKGFVSTARVIDSDDPFETAISYEPWGKIEALGIIVPNCVVVQTYKTEEDALVGHESYVKMFKSGQLPIKKPLDMGTSELAKLMRQMNDDDSLTKEDI